MRHIDKDKLIQEHMGMIRSVANMYADGHTDRYDDLFGAAMFGAAKAVEDFKEDEAASFPTFLRLCCRRAVFNELRKMKRWSREERGENADYIDDQLEAMWQDEDLNPEEQYIKTEEVVAIQERIAKLLPKLTERERYVFNNTLYTDFPMSIREIASQFRVGKSSIQRDKNRILKLLKENL